MTMRTYDYYVCPACGHRGHTLLSENDQPYSKNWERFEVFDLATRKLRLDEPGAPGGSRYICPKCEADMQETTKPQR